MIAWKLWATLSSITPAELQELCVVMALSQMIVARCSATAPQNHITTACHLYQNQNAPAREAEAFYEFNPGDDLLSHAVTRAVPWALEGLTTVFGMGTGVTPPV
jgi:hypothetical protein